MPKKMLIDATHAEETRVVVVDGNKVEEFDFESDSKRQLTGNIYLAKVTRVEPSLQAAFIEYGGNRHGFLAFAEIHPDYYQIPVADREALLAEEEAEARAESERADTHDAEHREAEDAEEDDAEAAPEDAGGEAEIRGMETVDGSDGGLLEDVPEARPAAEDGDRGERRRPRQKAKRYKIQEVVKVRQIMLVQVVKEERGNKGAALTTYLSLAGRYCVLMPNTARGGGISRKITQAADRKKLKEIASEIELPRGAGLIIRTAGAKRTKTEIRRDYEYLQRLWEQVRELTLKSVAPAKIYEEGDLIKRTIRDLYSKEIDEVIVEGEGGFRTARDFMRMIMPSHAQNVTLYQEPLPLFARHQVESYLAGMFNPTVQLKSGGYIVIGVTEALVAIDVNSGRATKQGSIEETATQTNLEAADEVARQVRLRDLAGLIVIDFIDMDDRRNNAAVEKRLKEALKTDRARIQLGRISGFGLLEMSRQRMRPGMLEATTQPCPSCHGTGMIRSDDSLALTVLRQIEEEGVRGRSAEVLVRAPVGVVNYLFNTKREHLAAIEALYRMAVRLEADGSLVSPDFSIDRFKTATRSVEAALAPVVTGDASLMDELDEAALAEEEEAVAAAAAAAAAEEPAEAEEPAPAEAEAEAQDEAPEADADGEEGGGRRKRRRRRRRRGRGDDQAASEGDQDAASPLDGDAAPEPVSAQGQEGRRTVTRRRRSRGPAAPAPAEPRPEPEAPAPRVADASAEIPSPERIGASEGVREQAPSVEPEAEPVPLFEPAAQRAAGTDEPAMEAKSALPGPVAAEPEPAPELEPEQAPEPAPEPEPELELAPEPEPDREPAMAEAPAEPEAPRKPKRRGWWSLGR